MPYSLFRVWTQVFETYAAQSTKPYGFRDFQYSLWMGVMSCDQWRLTSTFSCDECWDLEPIRIGWTTLKVFQYYILLPQTTRITWTWLLKYATDRGLFKSSPKNHEYIHKPKSEIGVTFLKNHGMFNVWTSEWKCDVTCWSLGIYKSDVEGLSLHVKLAKCFVIEIEYSGTLLTL